MRTDSRDGAAIGAAVGLGLRPANLSLVPACGKGFTSTRRMGGFLLLSIVIFEPRYLPIFLPFARAECRLIYAILRHARHPGRVFGGGNNARSDPAECMVPVAEQRFGGRLAGPISRSRFGCPLHFAFPCAGSAPAALKGGNAAKLELRGSGLSWAGGQAHMRMKLLQIGFWSAKFETGEVVQRFGSARLVRLSRGRLELRGGSPRDRGQAREWISLFGHDLMVECRPTGSDLAAEFPL